MFISSIRAKLKTHAPLPSTRIFMPPTPTVVVLPFLTFDTVTTIALLQGHRYLLFALELRPRVLRGGLANIGKQIIFP